MTYDEMIQAVGDAERTIRRADDAAQGLARLCAGRLRSSGVGHYTLCKLKRELMDYNMQTRKWKE